MDWVLLGGYIYGAVAGALLLIGIGTPPRVVAGSAGVTLTAGLIFEYLASA